MIWIFEHKYQLLVTLISLTLFGYFTSIILMYPNVGIGVIFDSKQIIISEITTNSWAEGKNIQIGDIVEKIDGQSSNENLKSPRIVLLKR